MNPWIHVTGWTLVHFVWQGVLIAVATAAALRVCRGRSAETRYAVACVGLAAMLLATAITAVSIWVSAPLPERGGDFLSAGPGVDLTSSRSRMASPDASAFTSAAGRTILGVDAVLPMVVWGWLTGVMLLWARFCGGYWRIHRLRVASLEQAVSPWQSYAESLARRLRVAGAFRVVESTLVDAPIVIGWIRPMVLLPVAALTNLAPLQVEALIAHELAHIRRRDYAINLLQTIAEALLFFHPAVWWVSSRIREEREHCCDDVAVEVCGEPTAYAEALTELASWRTGEPALSLGATDGSLLARIRRLLDSPAANEPRPMSALAVLALSVVVASAIAIASPSSLFATPVPAAGAPEQTAAGERRVRTTDHFEIHHPADLDLHADRVAREAERAYEQVSGDLKHNLAFKIPVFLFHTTNALEQSVQAGRAGQPAVTSTDGPRDRILLAADRPADQWSGLITHEVAHIFGFDILPGTATPRWITEGLAEYQRGAWDPNELVALRDAVRANTIPKMSALQGEGSGTPARLVSGLGHAAFEFIESRWGKPGMRQFLLALRQSARNGGDPYQAAFRISGDEFDQAFERYLKERFARDADQSPAQRFNERASVRIEGQVTAIKFSVSVGLACLELWVEREEGRQQRWAVECGDEAGRDLVRALKPGDRVVVTGASAREPGAQRILIRALEVQPAAARDD